MPPILRSFWCLLELLLITTDYWLLVLLVLALAALNIPGTVRKHTFTVHSFLAQTPRKPTNQNSTLHLVSPTLCFQCAAGGSLRTVALSLDAFPRKCPHPHLHRQFGIWRFSPLSIAPVSISQGLSAFSLSRSSGSFSLGSLLTVFEFTVKFIFLAFNFNFKLGHWRSALPVDRVSFLSRRSAEESAILDFLIDMFTKFFFGSFTMFVIGITKKFNFADFAELNQDFVDFVGETICRFMSRLYQAPQVPYSTPGPSEIAA